MHDYTKLHDRKTGETAYFYEWRRRWNVAQVCGELASNGWPSSWEEFLGKRLVEEGQWRPRKRRPGAGRKRGLDNLIRKQIGLSRQEAEAIRQAAAKAGVSQSAWIREAARTRLCALQSI